MKRIFTIALLIIAVVTCAFTFVACDKEETTSVVDYEIVAKTYTVGDKFATSDIAITANMSDETTSAVDSNLLFEGDDAVSLKLDSDGAFTEANTYKVKTFLLVADENRQDGKFYLGEWEVIVKAKK